MIKYDILQFSVVVDTLWWTKDYHQHTLSLACNSMKVVKAEQWVSDTFLQFSVQLVGNATALYGSHKRTDLVRLVRRDLAADNLHTKTVAWITPSTSYTHTVTRAHKYRRTSTVKLTEKE